MLPAFCPYQSTLTNPCHGGDLAIGFPLNHEGEYKQLSSTAYRMGLSAKK